MSTIVPVRMPKWGLSMKEGAIVDWWKKEGDSVGEAEDLVDIETSKISNVCESPAEGVLRRIVGQPGETLPVGALIGVLASQDATDQEIEAFIANFNASFTPEVDEAEEAAAMALNLVDIGEGGAIRVGRAGPAEGTPVVLIHGYGGDINNWLFNLEALAVKSPVIAVDLPGHGGSSKDVGDGALATLADRIVSAMSKLGVTQANLVGHSLGGAVAARIAADHPGLARSLILVCPAYLPGTRLSDDFVGGMVEAQRAKDIKPLLEMLFADPSVVSKDMIEDILKFKRTDGVEEALAALRAAMIAGDDAAALVADLNRLPPTVVIASRNDRIVGAPDESALPANLHVVWIDNAGHMPHLEQAGQVNALILDAIEGASVATV